MGHVESQGGLGRKRPCRSSCPSPLSHLMKATGFAWACINGAGAAALTAWLSVDCCPGLEMVIPHQTGTCGKECEQAEV